VILKTWSREAMKIDVSYLLPNLNQALLSSPVLVQACSYKKYSGTCLSRSIFYTPINQIDPTFCDITFPLNPALNLPLMDLRQSLALINERMNPWSYLFIRAQLFRRFYRRKPSFASVDILFGDEF
jgi:hypothetical protein